jgi:c-di-GMP-binding flagellar brake protein YcgR
MQERRRFNRCKVEQKARISHLPNKQEKGLLLDVAMGGMKVLLDEKAELGSQLLGQFKIVPYLGPFYIKGVVAWAKQVEDRGASHWEVGVKFTKVSTIPIQ